MAHTKNNGGCLAAAARAGGYPLLPLPELLATPEGSDFGEQTRAST
jgi:hypothetical protein